MKREVWMGLLGAIVLLIVGAVLGLITGMNIGGNYFPMFELGSMVGYEATGWIGLIIGGLLGAMSGYVLGRRIARRKHFG